MGLDFGTLSVRAVVVDAVEGKTVSEAVCEYAHGVMDSTFLDGTPLKPKSALQHPKDYLDSMYSAITESLASARLSSDNIAAVGVDFTGSTVLPIYKDGTPLCFDEKYSGEPNAYVKLWKAHAAEEQANRVTALAKERGEKWLAEYSGKVSSEWMIPKLLQILEESPHIYEAMDEFTEAGDWITRMLTGSSARSTSFAGFKALWNDKTGYPQNSFFKELHPLMDGIVGDKLSEDIRPVGEVAGYIDRRGAQLSGLPEGTPVTFAMLDAQAAMPAVGISGGGELMLILGTSGCFIINHKQEIEIKGICGRVNNAIFKGYYTYEAGQSCLGDGYDWFVKNFFPESYAKEAKALGMSPHAYLREKASKLRVGESGLLVLDWFNGNRSVLSDYDLTGMVLGLTLTTKPEEIYRAIIEASAFSSRMIIDTFADSGIVINSVCASGGIALKDEMMMQILADVTRKEIRVASSTQAGALGSAIYASVGCGIHPSMKEAVKVMSVPAARVYTPIEENSQRYDKLFEEYKVLHDYFGRGENDVMKRLMRLKY